MDYTKNYRLPQWVATDRIMRKDFNEAMRNIESGLSSAQTTADKAKETADQLPYAVGSYVGDGTAERYIRLGFRPSFVIASGQYESNTARSGADIFLIATSGTPFTKVFGLTDDGFRISHTVNAYPDLNAADRPYDYIAFR